MERFWRSLRAGCLDHLGSLSSLHEVQVRLDAFVADHYHRAPHGGLLGKTPAEAWGRARCRALDEPALTAAFLQHLLRRVRKDGTVDVAGRAWQLDQGFLAGRMISIEHDLVGSRDPVALHAGHRYVLRPVDAVAASRTRRRRAPELRPPTVPFDPAGALLNRAARRPPHHHPEEP